LSAPQHPEEEAALSLWTGSEEDEAGKVKVAERRERGRGGERKHDKKEVYR